ncbi:IclR family transcriptional regulator [Gordonia sp. PKS22-38]|uniref:IclR family transcriptional regulator n=1 Tax=Gordonia prachuapensis TaxID=3115651 RepID=A0ABU7MUU9_9ACTN|nr:IclR family transcriptional regulator [Gordonia sp. PKS22-38]
MATPVEPAGSSNREVVGAVLKACSLLEHFGADRPTWTLNELTTVSGMNKTTVHRLMATLIHAGWVDRTDEGAYRIGLRVFEIGSSALEELDIRSAARAYMSDLAEAFGDTAYLMVPAEQGAVCIDRVEGHNTLVVAGINVGTVIPYHAAAGPTVMLANSDKLRDRWIREGLTAFTDRTLVDVGALREHLDAVRRNGYSVSNADYLDGVAAVAAPIFDRTGTLIASISIGGRVEAFQGDDLSAKIERVRDAAARISTVVQAIPE